MMDLALVEVEKVYPLFVKKYEDFLPVNENDSMTSKMNAMIQYLNSLGRVSNQVVTQWNEVMKWLLTNGLKVDPEQLSELLKPYADTIQNDLNQSLESVTVKINSANAKMEELNQKIDGKEVATKDDLTTMIDEKGFLNEAEIETLIDEKNTVIKSDIDRTISQLTYNAGNVTDLKTESKVLVGAINEVFQLGNSRKQSLVEQLLSLDDSLPITEDSTWVDILNAVGNISTGVEYAEGACVVGSVTTGFQHAGLTSTQNFRYAEITDIPFYPSTIIVIAEVSSTKYLTVIMTEMDSFYRETIKVATFNSQAMNQNSFNLKGNVAGSTISADYCTIPSSAGVGAICQYKAWR